MASSRRLLLRMRTSTTRPLVLLVEDYEDAREMYRDYLEFSGFDVATAGDGREAVEKARAIHPDVILMDLSLPVMDGWEAARALKSSPETSELKIIALSAHSPVTAWAGARDSGCDAFIAKPCLPGDLVLQISAFLKIDPSTPANGRPEGPAA
jgi:CheY-like chemotaxis protein